MSQSWLIASGKGGVGKSMVTAALGVALARKSMQCCCVDADLGLRDLDMVLGLQSRVVYDMMDVVRHDCKVPPNAPGPRIWTACPSAGSSIS